MDVGKTSERWYRWVNTKDSEALSTGLTYDPVPFVPGMGADFFGEYHMDPILRLC